MDSHLATLDATLASIASLQRNLFTSPKPQPFTNAYLGPIDASLLPTGKAPRDFIRECDAFERNLFHFPAVGAVLDDDGITRRGRELTEDEAASAAATGADTAAELVPRNPQIRTVSVPTPLRDAGQRAHGGTKQQQQDAKVSLVAAQRLNDNYQRAPRARKHIRQLLKRNAELMSQSNSQSAQAAKLEDVLSRIANGESPKTMIDELTTLLGFGAAPDAGGTSSAAVSSSAEEEKRRKRRLKEMKDKLASVRDELNREEMEVLALEEMREDMLRKKAEIERRQQKASGPSETTSVATIGKPAGPSTARAVPRVVAAANAAKNRSPRKSVEATEVSATKKPTSTTATTTTSATSGAGPGAGVRKLAAGARASMRPSTGGPLSGVSALKKPSVVSSTSTVAGKPVSKNAIAPRASLGPNKAKSQSAGLASSTAPVEKHPAQTMPEAVPEPEDDITIRLSNRVPETRQSDEDTSGDNSLLVRPAPAGTAHSDFGPSALASADASAADPEATDELERLSEKIWNSFGDHLRYFLRDPDASDGGGGATEEDAMTDFRGTLQLLRRLRSSTQGDGSATGGAIQRSKDDASSISSAPTSLSGKTMSATGSTPPDVVARVTAFVLLELLTAPAPHMVDFPLLKTNAKAWFTENPSVLAKAKADDDEGEAASSDEEALVTKAVYAMVAKKLLRIRRTGGQAKVGFSPGD